MTILSATIGPIIQTHTGVLLKNDTDQMIVIPLFDENGDQYTGSVTNLGVNFILNGGTDVTLSTTCVYSATAGGHKLTIPSANITALGKYSACVTGDEIIKHKVLEQAKIQAQKRANDMADKAILRSLITALNQTVGIDFEGTVELTGETSP